MEEKAKRILVLIVKRSHRANGLLPLLTRQTTSLRVFPLGSRATAVVVKAIDKPTNCQLMFKVSHILLLAKKKRS